MADAPLPSFVSRQIQAAQYWFLDLEPKDLPGVAAVCGGWEEVAANYEVRRVNFPYLALEFVEDGLGELELNGRKHPLHPGTAFAYGPARPHVIRTDANRLLRKHYVDFQGRRAAEILFAGPLADGPAVVAAETSEVVELFSLLHRNGQSGQPHAAQVCGALVEALLHRLQDVGERPDVRQGPALATFHEARRFLQEHCLELDSLEAAAKALHLTPAYLARLFRRFDHTSPYQFLLRLKMRHAAAWLLREEGPIKTLARELRFADAFHFSKVFKQVYGMSPTHFQKRWRPAGTDGGEER